MYITNYQVETTYQNKHISGINHKTSIRRILGIRNLVTTIYLDITAYQVETTYQVTNNNSYKPQN
ncbi:hypothetical protein FWK35_00020254 [Aphis craccivora]|uniref:Uncharacterized protein n=1 Tax=Aphis craccivora TaxID=307492 RepID=A0A6G0WVA5_APHCR|nr:hypothetical protein FWK35_00020254 [Aphis craccivora]